MKEDIEARLAELRELVNSARAMPMSASAVVNRAELLEAADRLESAIHDGFHEAATVVGNKDAVVATGQDEAEEILRRAEAERDKLVSDTDVFRHAQQQADDLLTQTKHDCDALRAETDEYVESSLANFEASLVKTLDAVRRGRERLTTESDPNAALADDSDVDAMTLPDHLERG